MRNELPIHLASIASIADNAASSPNTNLFVALHTADPGVGGNQTTNEVGYTSYARVAVASTDWGSVTSNDTVWGQTGVSSVAASQKSFPAATATYSTAINGFFLASASTQGTLIYASNFDDTTAIATMAIGDIIKITPKFALGA